MIEREISLVWVPGGKDEPEQIRKIVCEALRKCGVEAAFRGEVAMEDKYFDTPSQALRRNRCGLRLRTVEGGETVCTWKADLRGAGETMKRREELNWPGADPVAVALERGYADVRLEVTVLNRRLLYALRLDGGSAELAVESVSFRSGSRESTAVPGLEIEILEVLGESSRLEAAILALGEALCRELGWQYSGRAKYERALRWAEGGPSAREDTNAAPKKCTIDPFVNKTDLKL